MNGGQGINMTDIELVIKISKEKYNQIINRYKESNVRPKDYEIAIINGKVLPKGHGRISDMDEAIECIKETEGDDAIWAISLIEWACSKRTIIEADKESEE